MGTLLEERQVTQVGHIARLAILAMSARAVADHEFDGESSVETLTITVTRTDEGPSTVDVAIVSVDGAPLVGFSL